MRVTDTSRPAGSSSPPSAPSSANTSSATISANSLKNGIGLAWTVSGGGGRGVGAGVGGVGAGVGVGNGTVSMANVLDFLLTSAQLHRTAAATVEKVRAGGRLIAGAGVAEDQAPGRSGHSSSSGASVGVSTSTTSILPSPSETWSRLLGNPASASQDHTLALLQMALQVTRQGKVPL
ncbi:uncharacterized protein [Procambarus clarkii]|uniref:uncharacterized protein n=1 Tax=Procambarus clarkii TaxID=6728 RepID=UPI00374330F6